jgi:hypothetical protein
MRLFYYALRGVLAAKPCYIASGDDKAFICIIIYNCQIKRTSKVCGYN